MGASRFISVANRSEYSKCERCWNHRPEVGRNAEHPTLCEHCVMVHRRAGKHRADGVMPSDSPGIPMDSENSVPDMTATLTTRIIMRSSMAFASRCQPVAWAPV